MCNIVNGRRQMSIGHLGWPKNVWIKHWLILFLPFLNFDLNPPDVVIQIHHLKSIRKPYEYKDSIYNIFTIYAWNIYFFQDLWIRFTYAIKDKKIYEKWNEGWTRKVCFMWKSTTTAKRYGVMKVRASEKGVKFERVQSCYYDTCASDQVSFQTKLEVFHLYHMELCIYTVHLVSRHWDIRHQPGEDPLQKSAHSLQDLLQHNIHSIILRELMFWNINIMLRMS